MITYKTIECEFCKKKFKKMPSLIRQVKHNFCSHKCSCDYNHIKRTTLVECGNCKTKFRKRNGQIKKTKNHFCSKSCAAIHNNKHKTYGIRRSKLELFLEENLRKEFPNLIMLPNDKTAIESEIDFYFPELKLGIEINGILHYEPIYGKDKLKQIKNNDKRKIIACYEKGIELIVIPTPHRYMTKQLKETFWDKIKEIIVEKYPR